MIQFEIRIIFFIKNLLVEALPHREQVKQPAVFAVLPVKNRVPNNGGFQALQQSEKVWVEIYEI